MLNLRESSTEIQSFFSPSGEQANGWQNPFGYGQAGKMIIDCLRDQDKYLKYADRVIVVDGAKERRSRPALRR